ncbi:MAG: AEC family transporter [Mogibacterium sp.]|nr:AEC family transporter [Mogibacterium sp.]
MLVIFSKVLVVFIYVGIGFAANRLKVLPGECVKYFTALIMNITVPCLMISAITGQELDAGMYRNTIILFVLTSLIYVIIAVLSSLFADHFFTDREQQDRNILASAMTGCNSGFMGFPVAKAVYGAKVFYFVVIQNISNNLYLFLMSIPHLHHREATGKRKRSAKEIIAPFANITTITTVVSIIMLFTGIKLPDYAMNILTEVGDITIPLSMILVGVQLGTSKFSRIFSDRDLIITAFIKLVVAPLLVVVLMLPLPVDPVIKLTSVLCTCFPSAAMGVATAAKGNKNSVLMAEAVAVSTVLSMITLPVWIMICSRLYM